MKKVLTLMTALLLSLAMMATAQVEFAIGDNFLMQLEDGTIIGSGFINQDGLNLEIIEDFSGDALLYVTDASGAMREFNVRVDEDIDSVFIMSDETSDYISAEQLLEQAGFDVDVSRVEELIVSITPGSSIGTTVDDDDIDNAAVDDEDTDVGFDTEADEEDGEDSN